MASVATNDEELWADLRQRPEDVGLLTRAAEALLADGDLLAAHGFAHRATELAETSPRPALLLASVLCRQGRAAEAVACLRARLDRHRDEPGYLLRLGQCEAMAGDTTAARETLLDALLRWPDDAEIHNDLGVVQHGLGEHGCAVAHFVAALALAPDHPNARANLRDVTGDDTVRQVALEHAYADAIARHPGDVGAIALCGLRHLERDQYRAAGNLLVRLVELDLTRARLVMGYAIDRLRRCTAQDGLAEGGTAAPYARRGLLHHLLHELDQAKICYEQALLRDADAAFAGSMLVAVNRAIGLAPEHRAFAAEPRANLARNREELAERALVLTSTPSRMAIASTNICNIDPPCVQCWKHVDATHGWLNGDARHLRRDWIERVAPFVRGAASVSLHGIGEPLANPHLFDTVRWCDDTTAVTFVSNALLFNEARIKKVLDRGVAMIDFSLDAGTAETFRKIRHNDFAKATGNIRRLVEERDRRGLRQPRIGINMCLMRANVPDIPAFVQLAHDLAVDVAHIFHMNQGASYRFDWFDYEEQLCERDPETHDRFVEQGFALAAELGVKLVMSGRRRLSVPDDARQHAGVTIDTERFFCPKPWDSLLIHVDGTVANCCWQARPIGHLEAQSTWQIWNGELLQDVRRSTAAGVPHAVCKGTINPCPYLGRA